MKLLYVTLKTLVIVYPCIHTCKFQGKTKVLEQDSYNFLAFVHKHRPNQKPGLDCFSV